MAVPNALLGGFGAGFNAGNAMAQNALDTRRRNQFAQLASQAYSTPPEGRNALYGQMAAIDPGGAQAQQAHFQSQEDRQRAQVVNASRSLLNAFRSGDQAAIQGAYQAVKPAFQQLAPDKQLPDQVGEDILPMLHQVLAQADGGTTGATVQSRFVGQDGNVYTVMRDGQVVNTGIAADRQMWFRDHPGMDPQLVDKLGNVQPVGAPQGAPMAAGGQMAPGEVPFSIDPNLPPEVQASIRANPQQWAAAPEVTITPGLPTPPRSLARPSEAQVAAETERARQQAQLEYLPTQERIRNEAAIGRLQAEQQVERMPAAVMKMVQEAEEKAGNAKGILDLMQGHKEKILSGDLQFGPVSNLVSRGRNYAGQSTEQSRNLQLFMSDLEKIRNDSLRLNNGVQTEGDAERAWNELLANLNDTQYVLAGLERIERINQRAAQAHAARAQEIRSAYPQGQRAAEQPAQGGYQVGQIIEANGRRYRVTGGDPNDPDVEEVR